MKNELKFAKQNASIQQLGYQFEFNIQIISIKIDYKTQFNFKILIKRGNKQNEIERIFKYNPYLDNEIPINEEFSIVSVLNPLENSNFDFNKNRVFHDKIYKIYICIHTKTGFKPAISGELNLSNYIDDNKENMLVLTNKTFNEVVIKFKVNSEYISEFDPSSGNSRLEYETQEIGESTKLPNKTYNEDYEKGKNDELLEKKYVNTLSTNRSNSIFSNILKDENDLIGKNQNKTEASNKIQLANTTKNFKENNTNNTSIQIISSNLIESSSKFDINNSYVTNASIIDESFKGEDINSYKNEIEKLRIEINKRKEYELKISEEYQKLLRNFQLLEQENKTLKGENENDTSIFKKKSIKESEIDEITLENHKQAILELNKENEISRNEIKVLKSALEELKKEKIKIFEDKSQIINNLRDEIEILNKQLSEQTRKSIMDDSLIKNHETEMDLLNEKIRNLEIDKNNRENQFKAEIEEVENEYNAVIKQLKSDINEIKAENSTSLEKINEKFNNLLKEKDLQITELNLIYSNKDSRFQIEKIGFEDSIRILKSEIRSLEDKLNLKEQELQLKINTEKESELGDLNKEREENQKKIELKEKQIKNLKHENGILVRKIELCEDKIKALTTEKDNIMENFSNAEKKFKQDSNNFKNKLEEKDNVIQSLMDEKEALRYENEKAKSELKNLEKNKSNDKEFFDQIQLIQQKAQERERKLIEEKDQQIKNIKKENENLTNQLRKNDLNLDKEYKKIFNENLFLKSEIDALKNENKEMRGFKDKLFKSEKMVIQMENDLIMKKVELSNKETEKEKLFSENKRLESQIFEHKLKIENLENDLLFSKQKLGDVLNEMSEIESSAITSERSLDNIDGKKSSFSFFKKR